MSLGKVVWNACAPELPFPIVRPTFQRPIILGSPSRLKGLGSCRGEFASVMFGGQFSEDEGDGCVADDSLPNAWIWISGEADRDVSLTRLRWPLLGSQTITSSIEQQIRVVWSQTSIRIEGTPVANQNHNPLPL